MSEVFCVKRKMILKKPVNRKSFIVNIHVYDFFFSFGRTFDRTFKARRRYFIFGVYTLFLKVHVILNLRYIFEEEKKRYEKLAHNCSGNY